MSAVKQLLGKKTWIGVLTALIVSFIMDAGGALLMARGMIAEMPTWVYGSYAIGAFIGVRVAVRGERGTLPRAMTICVIACAAVCLVGVAAYGGISLRSHGIGVLCGLLCGSLCGGLLGGGSGGHRKARRKRSSVKR